VHGDRIQVGQVLINLIKNSIDAIPEEAEGRIDV
jgi:C4-dicarboxylate-specific signal transduction histidine kinase